MSEAALKGSPPGVLKSRIGDSLHRFVWLVPIILALGVLIIATMWFWHIIVSSGSAADGWQPISSASFAFAVLLATLLSLLPALVCFVQTVSRRRQATKLDSLKDSPLADTTLYRVAVRAIDPGRLVVDADYGIPIIFFFLVCFIGLVSALAGYSHDKIFGVPSLLLGGFHPDSQYQKETFLVVAMAFFGSYVYTLSRMLDRINNSDLYPISLYYYTARIIIACLVAAVLRHTIAVFDVIPAGGAGEAAKPLLLLIGFGIGFTPDLFVVAMIRRAFQAMKIWGAREEPKPDTQPSSLALLMIDDLTREKIDRLNELEIDSAQALARQNPFRLLPRLPYDLALIVDWIAQAQLYTLVRDAGLKNLRETIYVRDVFCLHAWLADEQARPLLCQALGLSAAAGKAMLQQLEEDASYLRLREVEEAMRPQRHGGVSGA